MPVAENKSLVDRLNRLMAIDHDAAVSYGAAIERIEDAQVRRQLSRFKSDHERHVRDLEKQIRKLGGEPRAGGKAKQLLSEGKVILPSSNEMKQLMQQMKKNEDQTNRAYEQALRTKNLSPALQKVLERNYEDEKRHRSWIIEQLDHMKAARAQGSQRRAQGGRRRTGGRASGIDLNKASAEELERLEGIGRIRAQRLVKNRPYDSWDDVRAVDGIHETLLEKLKRGAKIG